MRQTHLQYDKGGYLVFYDSEYTGPGDQNDLYGESHLALITATLI